MDVDPAPPRRTRRDELTDELRRRILSGELPPGRRLAETALADELGVSRIPLREAFRSLESEGLLAWAFRQGVTVVGVDPAEAPAVAEIRRTLERLAVRLAAEGGGPAPEDRERLAAVLRAGQDAVRADHDAAAEVVEELDRDFHRALAAASGSPLLERLLHLAWQRADQLGAAPDLQPPHEAWADHVAIARSVAAGDPDAAEARLAAHLKEGRAEN